MTRAAWACLIVAAALALAAMQPGPSIGASCRLATVSWYGSESGNRTASGLAFDGSQLIAAHKSLPFGTKVRFTYRGKSVTVPIEDRGPWVRGREFDLSRAAAKRLGIINAGVAKVCVTVL
jgi:rare lipoprotein A